MQVQKAQPVYMFFLSANIRVHLRLKMGFCFD